MKEYYQKNRVQVNKAIFVVLFFIAMYVFVNYIFKYIAPFFIAYLLSVLLNPIVEFLVKKIKAPRWFASVFALLLLIFFLLSVGTNLVSTIVSQAQGLAQNLPSLIDQATDMISDISDRFSVFVDKIPEDFQNTFYDWIDKIVASLTSSIGGFFGGFSVSAVGTTINSLLAALLCLISTFFFLKDREVISRKIFEISPYGMRKSAQVLKKGIANAIIGYIKAQSIIMSVICVIGVTSLGLMKYNYALLVGIIIAAVDALPLFGGGLILWPWIIFSLITREFRQAVWLLATYGTIFITRQSLEPKILGDQIGIHPLLTLMSIYIGVRIYGVFGFLIGPLTIVVMKTILEDPTTT